MHLQMMSLQFKILTAAQMNARQTVILDGRSLMVLSKGDEKNLENLRIFFVDTNDFWMVSYLDGTGLN